MPYLVFDTETTGLPDWRQPADAPGQPRLASFALLCVDDDLEIEDRTYGLVLPDGWQMPAEATAVNGLTNEQLQTEGFPISYVMNLFHHAAIGRTLVAHNLQFDTKIARGEFRRLGGEFESRAQRWLSGICTMRSLVEACAIPHPTRSGYKYPRLGEACTKLLGGELVGAHHALTDAKACLRLLRYMIAHNLCRAEAA